VTPFGVGPAAILVALGLGVGAFGTLVGAGGGFVLTPILLLLYPHDSAQTLTGISLVVVFFNAASGSLAYARQRRIDYRSGSAFALATVPGAIGGALLVGLAPRRVFDRVIAAVLAALAAWLVLGREAAEPPARNVALRRGIAYSLVVGFVSSFLGIGGGVIHVPLLVRALGFPTHVATATSHFVLAIMAGSASITHVLAGSFHHGHGLRRAAALSVGVVAGAQVGAHASLRVGGRSIQLLLALALTALAIRLAV
jgi:uncharacterized membrane protein YfcA